MTGTETTDRYFLPFDGGDSSPRNSQTFPFRIRKDPAAFTYSGSSYTGGVFAGTWTGLANLESKESYNHPVRWLGRSHRNIGGKFVHTRVHVGKFGDSVVLYKDGSTWRQWSGVLGPSGYINSLAPSDSTYAAYQQLATNVVPLASNNDLDASGTTAIARVAPTNPLVDLSTSAAELLREGLPQVPGRAGNVGGEYLNVMFGYLPLYGDVTDVVRVARNHDALLRQYERDSGRWIRRHYEFPETVSSTSTVQTNSAPYTYGSGPGGLANLGVRTIDIITRKKIWFDGAFTYHLPRNGWRRSAAELDHLYGIRPGLDTIYQLTPYSWLVDYFTNVGDVMQNITAFKQDGLVMPFGYVMCKQTVTRQETWSGDLWINGDLRRRTITSEVTFTTHQRRLAHPFGFGLTDDGLSLRQKSILVALGISRV